jgi:hypothetical protein
VRSQLSVRQTEQLVKRLQNSGQEKGKGSFHGV